MDFLLDPYVIQMPKPFENKTHLIEYITTLAGWCKLLDEPNEDKFWFSAPALEELWASGQFPRYTQLKEIFDDINDDSLPFDPIIASRACENLNSPPYIDDQIQKLCPDADNILPDEDELILIPDAIRQRLQPKVAEALIQTFTKLAFIHKQYGISVFEDLFFATRALDALNDQIEIRTRCFHISSGNFYIVEDKWKSVSDPDKSFDIEESWQDTAKAVEWAFRDLMDRRELDRSNHKLPAIDRWRVGKHFNESITRNHFDRKETLTEIFHAAVKILIRYWGIPEHDHNKHLQRGADQVKRKMDGALAWRAHVTNEPDMLRLHYWLIDGTHIELSNVVFKKDLFIEQD